MSRYTVITARQAREMKRRFGLEKAVAPKKQRRKHPLVVLTKSKLPPAKEIKKSYSKQEFRIGTHIEMEHTEDRKEAAKIAKEHLSENPDYYKDDLFATERKASIAKAWPTVSTGEVRSSSKQRTSDTIGDAIPPRTGPSAAGKHRIGMQKAKPLPEGTIREWKGQKRKKVGGKWVPYSEGKVSGTAQKPVKKDKEGSPKDVKGSQEQKKSKIGEIEQSARENGKAQIKIGEKTVDIKWTGTEWQAKVNDKDLTGSSIEEIGTAAEGSFERRADEKSKYKNSSKVQGALLDVAISKLGKEGALEIIADAFMDNSTLFNDKLYGDTEALGALVEGKSVEELAQIAEDFDIDFAEWFKGSAKEEEKGSKEASKGEETKDKSKEK